MQNRAQFPRTDSHAPRRPARRGLGRAVLAGALVAGVVAASATPAGAHFVAVEPLAPTEITPSQGHAWFPQTISTNGRVLLGDVNQTTPLLWSEGAGRIDVGALNDGVNGPLRGLRMNENGVVAGVAGGNGSPWVPFVFDWDTRARKPLAAPPGTSVDITDIGRDGTIVGYGSTGPGDVGDRRAAAWVGDDHELKLLPDGGAGSTVLEVNGTGTAIGTVNVPYVNRSVAWDIETGTMTDIDALIGQPVGVRWINDLDQVVVRLGINPGQQTDEVVLDLRTGEVHRLFAPYGGSIGGLNDRGEVLYEVYGPNGPTTYLRSLVDGTTRAAPAGVRPQSNLNDRGQIAFTLDQPGATPGAVVYDFTAGLIGLGYGGGRGLQLTTLNDDGVVGGAYGDTSTPWVGIVRLSPEAPQQAAASLTDPTHVALTWQAPVSPGDAPISGYAVRRDGEMIAVLQPTARSYTDDVAALAGRTVTYTLTAVNDHGESGSSPTLTITVPGSGAAPTPATPVAASPQFTG